MIKISNRFEISFDANEIITMSEENFETRIKVEPRNMHVLKILLNNSPNVVSREQLISEVWNNYGGADDALNQSISHLRKLLNDTNKENRIIETVVKKGYRFVGTIEESRVKNNNKQRKSRFWVMIVAIALLVLVSVIYIVKTTNSFVPLAPEAEKSNSTTPAPDVEN